MPMPGEGKTPESFEVVSNEGLTIEDDGEEVDW
jgi:hypothetical protein